MAFREPQKSVRLPYGGCFGAWFVFCALLGLGLLGVVVWAVIAVVNHVTG
jgi:hypothetical protein